MASKGSGGQKSVLKHTDTVGALPSLDTAARVSATKKLSHPGMYHGPGLFQDWVCQHV